MKSFKEYIREAVVGDYERIIVRAFEKEKTPLRKLEIVYAHRKEIEGMERMGMSKFYEVWETLVRDKVLIPVGKDKPAFQKYQLADYFKE